MAWLLRLTWRRGGLQKNVFMCSTAGTWGPQAEWGEHEMDYILFVQADVTLKPNPEEVMVSPWTRSKLAYAAVGWQI